MGVKTTTELLEQEDAVVSESAVGTTRAPPAVRQPIADFSYDARLRKLSL